MSTQRSSASTKRNWLKRQQKKNNVVEAIARLSTTVYQETYIHFGLIKQDVDDNKFVDCAVAADAEFIVSNDKHFKVLEEIDRPKVIVLKIQEFMQQIELDL